MLPQPQKLGGIAQPILSGVPATPSVTWSTRVVDVRVAEPQWWTIIVGAPRQATYQNPFGPGAGIPAQGQPDPDPCRCFLRVQFGTAQIMQTLDIDCGMGGCLPIFGSQVQVDVLSTNTIFLGAGGQEPGAIPVSISPGFTSRTLPAVRTIDLGTVVALATVFATCPPFAVRVEHAQSATATLSRTIAFHRRNAATVFTQYTYLVSTNRFAPAYPEWTAALPIPFDCSRVSYLNNDAAAPASVRFLFQLGI
jgi:hypothetical protein